MPISAPWQPTTVSGLEAIVSEQLRDCSPEQQAWFAAHRVPFHAVPIHRCGNLEQVLVVAAWADCVLYFEDIEEGFAMTGLGLDGAVEQQDCNQYELMHVLPRAGVPDGVAEV